MSFALTDNERSTLIDYQNSSVPALARRAAIILLSEKGLGTGEIAHEVALSRSQVRHWRRAWAERRLGIFPKNALSEKPGSAPVAVTDSTGITPRLSLALQQSIDITPEDTMAEAGRKVLHFHFERMLFHEPGSRLGEDIEAVHDMRVATRRMRSALRLFAPYFDPAVIHPFARRLRRTARALGAVRDLDVFRENVQHFVDAHPGTDLGPLFDLWEADYQPARLALLVELDSKRFARFVKRFHKFLTTPGQGALPPTDQQTQTHQVRHVAPRLIYEHYEQVRAYEAALDGATIDTLHALRIDFKRLRYTMEFFREVLGSEAGQVIKEIKTMQDHLGNLNDARVAEDVLRSFIAAYNKDYSGTPRFMRPNIDGVLAYAQATTAEKARLLATFPDAWANFTRADVRRSLALAVSVL